MPNGRRFQQVPDVLGWERVQPQLAVVRLVAPGVLVLKTVGHEQQQAGRRQAVDERVEEGLRLTVDPVKVFEDQEEWLLPRFTQEQQTELPLRTSQPCRRCEWANS